MKHIKQLALTAAFAAKRLEQDGCLRAVAVQAFQRFAHACRCHGLTVDERVSIYREAYASVILE